LCRTKIKPGGAKSNWQPGELKDELVEEYLKPALAALAEVCDARGRALLPPAALWLGGAAEAFARRKEEAGVLDFQDLLLGAARLLRRKETGAREYFQRRFRHILVDEFQDTDPLQVELIFYLAEDGPVADDWRDAALVPGKLFVVGDPKQSIYRFRRADIEVYEAARRVVEASGGETLRLTDNFRSAPRLISFVNRAFGGVFGEGEPPYQPAYGKLEPSELAASRAGEGAGAFILEGPGGEFGSEAAAADAVAAFIRRAVLEGEFDVFDAEGETRRPVAYRDFAVLFRSRTHVRTWESALEAWGVPFYTYGGQTFYVRPEVKALAAAARAVDNPADELALVAALTSSLFSLTPDDLLRFHIRRGVFDYREKLPGGEPAGFRPAWELLGRLHRERPDRTPAATLADLVSSSRLLTKSALWGDGPRAVANVRKILAAARRYAAAGGVGLRGFARWLTEMAEREEAEHESPALDTADDFVRLLTVHAAKGLEFPAVVFADWGRKAGGGRGDAAVVDRRTGLLHLRVGSEKAGTRLLTPGYEDAAEREEHFGRCEERRLDYVAATRARDVLVLPAMAEAAEDSLAATVAAFGEDERPVEVVRIDAEAERATLTPATPEGASAPDLASGRDDWERDLAESVRRAAVPAPIIGASALAHVEEERDEDFRVPASPSKDALRKGLALHAVMEVLDLAGGDGVAEAAGRACRELGLGPEDERDVAAWAANCLSSAPVREAAAAPAAYREMPFSVTVGDAMVAGKIDLAYEAEDGWVIVDYKSDDPAAAAERAGREYRDQMAVYAAALGRVAGVTPVRVYLIFAREADAERRAVSPGPASELLARGDELLDDAPRRAAETGVF
jgi:ATP-dependent helicase/nuclease subunit A